MVDRLRDLTIKRVAFVPRGDDPEARIVLWKAAPEDDGDVFKQDYSSEQRSEMARTGAALPDGSFPIANATDLRNAVQAFGRAKDKGRVKAHIVRRARSLGKTDLLPEGWVSKSTSAALGRLLKAWGLDALAEAGGRKEAEVTDTAMKLPDDLPEDVRKFVEALQAERDEAKAALAKVEAEAKEHEDPEADPVAKALEGANPVIKAALERAQAEAAEAKEAAAAATAAIAKAEDERATRAVIEKARTWRHLPIKAEEFGPLLRKVQVADPEVASEVERILTSINGVAAEAFRAIGKSGDEANPVSRLEAMAAEYAKEHEVTPALAMAKVVETPEGRALYREQKAEKEATV